MRLGEYFEIGKKMKQARTNAKINQRDMSIKLALTNFLPLSNQFSHT